MEIDLSKATVSDVIAALSLSVAILSLLINIIPLIRDRAKVDFSLYLAEVFPKTVGDNYYYAFRVANSGRRPVTITHIGGVTENESFINYWVWRLTGRFPPTMFMINDPGLVTLLKDSSGKDKTLFEGDYSFGTVEIDPAKFKQNGPMKAHEFHVIDSIGRYHRLPRKAHRLLKKKLAELNI